MLLGPQITVIQPPTAITKTLGNDEMDWAESVLRASYNPHL
jgi:hypothetical protein